MTQSTESENLSTESFQGLCSSLLSSLAHPTGSLCHKTDYVFSELFVWSSLSLSLEPSLTHPLLSLCWTLIYTWHCWVSSNPDPFLSSGLLDPFLCHFLGLCSHHMKTTYCCWGLLWPAYRYMWLQSTFALRNHKDGSCAIGFLRGVYSEQARHSSAWSSRFFKGWQTFKIMVIIKFLPTRL